MHFLWCWVKWLLYRSSFPCCLCLSRLWNTTVFRKSEINFIISNNILTIFVHRYTIPHFHLWYQWLGPLLQWVSSRIDGFWAVWTNIYPIFFVHTLHNEGIVKTEVALLAHWVEFAFHIQWCEFEILQKTFWLTFQNNFERNNTSLEIPN